MSTNVNKKENYKLSDIIKELKLTRKNVPSSKVILGWLKGTEFDVNEGILTTDKLYNYNEYRACKKFIETTIKNKFLEAKAKNKLDKCYLYISIGGTNELINQFKIEAKDHLSTRILSPKGCDKYCTENQIGKPQNWVKLPVILMPNGDYFDEIKKELNTLNYIEKVSNNTYRYVGNSNFISTMENLQNQLNSIILKLWYKKHYESK